MILQSVFLLTTLLFLLYFYLGTGRNKRVLMISVAWMLIITSLSSIGFFEDTETIPPRFLVVLLGNIFFIGYVYKTQSKNLFDYPIAMLIHTLRIPVEVTLYALFLEKQVPEIMTFNGLNFDILVGFSALILFLSNHFFKFKLSSKALLIWNILGLLFLINIVVIAILSAPLPIQQLSFEQPNIAVLKFPYILLPSLIVPIVLLTHILNIRQLTKKS